MHRTTACPQDFAAYREWFQTSDVINPEWMPAFYGDLNSHMCFLGKLTSEEYFVTELETFNLKYGRQPPPIQG